MGTQLSNQTATYCKRPIKYHKYFETAEVKVVFDHHTKNAMFGDYNIVNHVSPSASQVLMTAFEYWGLEITKDVLTCIMTGVITDTGGFRNSNITAETFELAAYATTKGVNISKLGREGNNAKC